MQRCIAFIINLVLLSRKLHSYKRKEKPIPHGSACSAPSMPSDPKRPFPKASCFRCLKRFHLQDNLVELPLALHVLLLGLLVLLLPLVAFLLEGLDLALEVLSLDVHKAESVGSKQERQPHKQKEPSESNAALRTSRLFP